MTIIKMKILACYLSTVYVFFDLYINTSTFKKTMQTVVTFSKMTDIIDNQNITTRKD